MARRNTLLRFIDQVAGRVRVHTDADADLLQRFVTTRDNHSFAALVDRHGQMVLQVCLRVLGHSADAEDAAQAVFLVLARKARTLRDRQALPAWLFGVARRTALKARAARNNNPRAVQPVSEFRPDPRLQPVDELSGREFLSIIDEEIQRLPSVYRLPMILCCVEGRSIGEVAGQLHWSQGSVKGRLERGRQRLHEQLVRRGLTLAAGVAAIDLSGGPGIAAAAAKLLGPISLNASALAGGTTSTVEGVTAGASALAREMLKAFAFPRYAVAAIILLGMGAISAGIMNSVEDNGSAQPQPAHVANVQEEIARLEGGPPVDEDIPIRVSGRVLQPDGQPCARASLYMGLAERGARPDGEHPRHTTFPLRATTGADGRFQFAFTRSQLNMAPLENAHPALMAVAKGYGFGWTVIPDWQTEARANIQLVDDRPVGGRIVDGEGNPVANLKVKIFDVAGTGILMWKGTIPELPEMIRTDADGRFRLPGVGFNRVVGGTVEGANIVTSGFMAIAGIVEMKQIAYAGFTVKGAVRDRKTKLPIPEVALSWQSGGRSTLTDAKGNYELRYRKSDGHQQCIFLYPQTGLHFSAGMHLPLNVSADTVRLDFELDSGIVLTGKVTNVAKGKPPSAATVTYHPLPSNTSALPGGISSALVRPDGAYTLAVRPGPGLVCVAAAPRDAYALAVMDRQAIDKANGEPVTMEKRDIVSSAPYYYKLSLSENNLIVPINPDEKTQSMTLNLPLQAASHVQGMVIGPDGKPQEDVECCGLNALPRKVDIIKDGSFTVLGLNGQTQKDLYFRQAKRNLGRVYHLPGNAREPVQIELYPLGNISGRLLDPAGKPVANWPVFLHHQVEHNDIVDLLLSPTFTDPDGAFREEVLPEVKYKVEYDRRICRLANDPGEIEVRPNETKDLGDLIMAAAPKPPAK